MLAVAIDASNCYHPRLIRGVSDSLVSGTVAYASNHDHVGGYGALHGLT
ncbi:hypothetical protein GA0070609_5058 [Micromonospora echinaurantiaca]|uniref:Uncharacterized protein n=1 Tax=Micromonospora echinaurantiaca TaxID=47857 RepID=A0A1C5JWM6_9ACTN|nr:hypothetical protein GA0070609_5058 [Micromonospora echinaurantiaca]